MALFPLMIVSILFLLFSLAIYFTSDDYSDGKDIFKISSIIWIIAILLLFFVYVNGINSNYGSGYKEGFLVKVDERGNIWKTTEASIQIGTGENTGINGSTQLSTNDPKIKAKLQTLIGKHIRVTYKQWFSMPISIGETNLEIVSIEEVQSKK